MKTRLQTFSIAALLFVILPTLLTPIAASALDEPAPRIGGHAENGNALVNGEYGDSESDPAGPPNDHDPADDIPPLTNEAESAPASVPYKDAAPCKQVFLSKAPNSPIISDNTTVDDCPLPPDPEGGPNQNPGRAPTTRDLLYLATAVVHADGAGLCISVHWGCHTRTSTYPPSSQSHVPHKLTWSPCLAAKSQSHLLRRTTSGAGAMELRTWSPPPQDQSGPRAWI